MVVSTGIGGGLVLEGRLVQGNSGNAGHVGHIIVCPEGRLCSCGGCLEAEASGWAIASITARPRGEAGPEIIDRTARLVGRALSALTNLCDFDLLPRAPSRPSFQAPPDHDGA
jgi:glucokinase